MNPFDLILHIVDITLRDQSKSSLIINFAAKMAE